jgi:hypothetical protein
MTDHGKETHILLADTHISLFLHWLTFHSTFRKQLTQHSHSLKPTKRPKSHSSAPAYDPDAPA